MKTTPGLEEEGPGAPWWQMGAELLVVTALACVAWLLPAWVIAVLYLGLLVLALLVAVMLHFHEVHRGG